MRRLEAGSLAGAFRAPASKSHAIRLLALAALAEGESVIVGVGRSRDVAVALDLVRALGARVALAGDTVRVRGPARRPAGPVTLDCGESALCLRMFTGLAAALGGLVRLEAQGSLRARPLGGIEGALAALGARCTTEDGRPPVEVEGPLSSREADLDATLSSQGVTGLLLALAAAGGGLLRVHGLVSAPYVDLTRAALAVAGVRVEAVPDGFLVPAGQRPRPFSARVEGDWSGAAFPLVAAAMGGDVTAFGLDSASFQADRAVLEALRAAGAGVALGPHRVRVSAGDLRPFDFDLTPCPDLGPPLAALAAACPGVSHLRGAGRLRAKESDRVVALSEEFGRLGVRIEARGDELHIHGGPVGGGEVDARGDHRIAMALGVLALRARGPLRLAGAGAVTKSWPGFWRTLARLRGAARAG